MNNINYNGIENICINALKKLDYQSLLNQNVLSETHSEQISRINDEYIKKIRSIKELGDSSTLNISFFGETNAGKSLILETLRMLFDGEIIDLDNINLIGEGFRDTTQTAIKYRFCFNNNSIIVRDTPGIEGNEKKYIDIINENLSQSHVIFYVLRGSKIPDRNTLERIKKYIKSDTEVYLIHNISFLGRTKVNEDKVKRYLEFEQRINTELQNQKKNLHVRINQLFTRIFKNQYKGMLHSFGFMAFAGAEYCYSKKMGNVDSISPSIKKKVSKFLYEVDNQYNSLINHSNIYNIATTLGQISSLSQEKIYHSIKLKLRNAVDNLILDIKEIATLSDGYKQSMQDLSDKVFKLERLFSDIPSQIRSSIKKAVRNVCLRYQEVLEKRIKSSNGYFNKDDFYKFIDSIKENLENDLSIEINKVINNLTKKLKESILSLKEELCDDIKFNHKYRNIDIDFDFKEILDSFDEIFTSILKGLGAAVTALLFSTPLTAVIALGASLLASVVSFFMGKTKRINKALYQANIYFDKLINEIVKRLLESDEIIKLEKHINSIFLDIKSNITLLIDKFDAVVRFFNLIVITLKNESKKVGITL